MDNDLTRYDPAARLIRRHGAAALARLTGRTESAVHRWAYPRSRGGCDGMIPSRAMRRLIDAVAAGDLDDDVAAFLAAPAPANATDHAGASTPPPATAADDQDHGAAALRGETNAVAAGGRA